MRLDLLFKRCLEKAYIHTENGGDYACERRENVLYIYLQCSEGGEDWKNNLDFPATPYRRMGRTVWRAHRGFLRVWKSVEPHLAPKILDSTLESIVTVGYSHGAALAVFCHEYAWFHRPDLRARLYGFGFGCPRVLWGLVSGEVLLRWEGFLVVRNLDDLVTHLPPAWLGYRHAGRLLEIGEKGKYSPVNAHRPKSIYTELYALAVKQAENHFLSKGAPV